MNSLKKDWWKYLSVLLVIYTLIMGFLGEVPRLAILNETIRNLYFHVTMWFAMLAMYFISVVNSIKYLANEKNNSDIMALESAHVGSFVAVLGILTGMVWAKFTWGAFWVNDPKLNGAAITLMAYLAYFILRSSIEDEGKKARISAVYNIFAFVMMIVFIQVLPRLTDSLHPGNGGNPAFSNYDLDSNMRTVFYPAVIGWALFAYWMVNLRVRLRKLNSDF